MTKPVVVEDCKDAPVVHIDTDAWKKGPHGLPEKDIEWAPANPELPKDPTLVFPDK